VVVVSAVFRKNQIFFKPTGFWARPTLRRVSHFFAQNQESLDLLERIGVHNHSLSGDSRFDRVWEAAGENRSFPLVETFLAGRMCFMAGSTWPYDDKLLETLLPEFPSLKFVVVPHHVDDENIRRVLDLFGDRAALYSQGEAQGLENKPVLVVDTIGMLTYLYRLADLTYIGDGFGGGIHSILEPAVFGMPIFFGPRYRAFQEAVDLVERKGVFSVSNRQELVDTIRRFTEDPEARSRVGRICREYVEEKAGATEKVLEGLKPFLAGP
jgi:3-deoxy-D-manno-octulosonic-acid transferase